MTQDGDVDIVFGKALGLPSLVKLRPALEQVAGHL
jgi:hypothetical protein